MLNIKKTGTLFTLATSVGQLLNLWSARIKYTGNEIIIDDIDDINLEDTKKDSRKGKYNSKTLIYNSNQDKF
jgi:hypothetical protein